MIKQSSKANVIVSNSISMTREFPQDFYQEKVFLSKIKKEKSVYINDSKVNYKTDIIIGILSQNSLVCLEPLIEKWAL